jgi:hypothetical protein
MQLISCFLLIFVVGCSSATDKKDRRDMSENRHYVWELMTSPDPAYVCYRYTSAHSTYISERTHIVCLDKSKVTPEVKDCD